MAGAVLLITDTAGHEIVRLTTASDGSFRAQLPAGSYTLTPQPVDGLIGLAPPVDLTVTASGATPVDVEYDTGIR